MNNASMKRRFGRYDKLVLSWEISTTTPTSRIYPDQSSAVIIDTKILHKQFAKDSNTDKKNFK